LIPIKNSKAAWLAIAEEFSGYINPENIYKMLVYEGEVPDFGPAAILRIWQIEQVDDEEQPQNVVIKATLALTADTAWCSDMDRGLRVIDLNDPHSLEKILQWFKTIGLVAAGTQLRGPLAS
jgi:hypothetical protein